MRGDEGYDETPGSTAHCQKWGSDPRHVPHPCFLGGPVSVKVLEAVHDAEWIPEGVREEIRCVVEEAKR